MNELNAIPKFDFEMCVVDWIVRAYIKLDLINGLLIDIYSVSVFHNSETSKLRKYFIDKIQEEGVLT